MVSDGCVLKKRGCEVFFFVLCGLGLVVVGVVEVVFVVIVFGEFVDDIELCLYDWYDYELCEVFEWV